MQMIDAMQLTQQALWLVLGLSAPVVVASAVVGCVVALLQACMQLQEQSLQYAAKFAVNTLVLLATASLFGSTLLTYSDQVFSSIATAGRP